MEENIDYNELFKAKFDDEGLNKLIALSEDEESEHEFNNEEQAELLRLEGRRRMENIKLAEELQRFSALRSGGFSALNLKRNTQFKISTNVRAKNVTRHYAKPMLPAGVLSSVLANHCQ